MEISEKVKEAETYRSMGLLEESIIIYEKIISSEKSLEDTTRTLFESTVTEIRDELASLENGEEDTISEEEIAIIRDKLPIIKGVPHLLDSASAFMELGLYKEALSEYEKLLNNESTWRDILQDLTTCLLKCCDPSEIFPTVKKMVTRTETNDQNKSEIQFRLGLEMQKRDHKVLAQELCRSAKELDPDNEEIEKWLDSNSFRQKILSKYDHLILQKKITPGQLKKALALSKKTGKSIEFILVHYFKINKTNLGKSISLFYNCPFRQYDKNILTPFELVIHLERRSLENSHWVPLSSDDGLVDVLIDDPSDLIKKEQIMHVLKNYNINFLVGIKEDIEKFIQRFFNESEI